MILLDKRTVFLLAVLIGSGIALLFSQVNPTAVQNGLQQAVGATAAQNPSQVPGFWIALFSAFVVGVSIVVTPCLLPVLFTFLPAASGSMSKKDIHSNLLFYSLGLVGVSAGIGVVAGFLGGQAMAFLQTFLDNAKSLGTVLFSGMGALFFIWGLRAFHFIDLPSTGIYYKLSNYIGGDAAGTHRESLLYGAVIGTAIGISCPIPTYHALLLWAAIVGNPWFGLVLLTLLGIGRVLPLWILLLLPQDRVDALTETLTENPQRMHTYNGFVITLLGSFLLTFWIGVMHLNLL